MMSASLAWVILIAPANPAPRRIVSRQCKPRSCCSTPFPAPIPRFGSRSPAHSTSWPRKRASSSANCVAIGRSRQGCSASSASAIRGRTSVRATPGPRRRVTRARFGTSSEASNWLETRAATARQAELGEPGSAGAAGTADGQRLARQLVGPGVVAFLGDDVGPLTEQGLELDASILLARPLRSLLEDLDRTRAVALLPAGAGQRQRRVRERLLIPAGLGQLQRLRGKRGGSVAVASSEGNLRLGICHVCQPALAA